MILPDKITVAFSEHDGFLVAGSRDLQRLLIDHMDGEVYFKLKSLPRDTETLQTALMNAVKPNYHEESGEYVLWCGTEEHAQSILNAAKIVLNILNQGKP